MSYQTTLAGLYPASPSWCHARDGDPRARALYRRHYPRARYRTRRPQLFVGPGEKLVLLTADGLAALAWRRFKDDSGQTGACCSFFRNEGPLRSSTLIAEAMDVARRRWPGARLYTWVDPRRVASPNPGYCIQAAGWRRAGQSKSGLLLLEHQSGSPCGRTSGGALISASAGGGGGAAMGRSGPQSA